MDELNAEQRQELEEQLYSQVHHKFDESFNNFETKNLENAEKNASNSKFQTKRYWAGKNLDDPLNEVNSMSNSAKIATKSINNDAMPRTQPSSATIPAKNTNPNNNNRRIRNPFASLPNARKAKAMQQNCNKQNNMQQLIKQTQRNAGPFAEKMQKIQRLSNFHNKKQKANNARAKAHAKPRVVASINLDDDDTEGDDDVLIVPLPPVPVVSVESDSDENAQQQNPAKNQRSEPFAENSSRCVSPASVMSHDDFIAQGDRNRLLVMNNNADSFLEAPSPTTQNKNDSRRISSDDIECIGTFIKPSSMNTKAAGKKDYRVGSNEFRAMDVYESESDIVSDGVYSKGLKNAASSTVGNKSDDSDNDDGDFADIAENPKNRRLRKRRASTSQRGSESNGGGANTSDSENDGVVQTGVPFIYCGPALERQKSKKKRRRNESTLSNGGRMSDTEFVATLNSLAQGGETMQVNESESDDDPNENMPTARDIAEIVLNQSTSVQQEQPLEQLSESIDEIIELPSTPPDDEAIPPEFAENVDRILAKLNALKKKQMQASENAESAESEDDIEAEVSTELLSTSDVLPLTAAVKAEISANGGLNANNADEENDGSKKIKYFIAYCPANKRNLSDGFGWNEEMRRFYNYSWGGESFREDVIFRTMKRNANLWRISNVDRFPSLKNRSKREKCMNCLSFGHSRAKCPKPRRPRICYMCGESGHLEARCPNTLCLQCGSETMSFVTSCKKCMHWNKRICPICKLRGHSLNDCPDKWRRYHSTTKPNQFPISHVNYNRRRYCCYCGMRGHLSDECRRSFNNTEYPMIASEIKSFEKSYNDVLTRTNSTSGIQCQLLYDPKLNVNFTMAQKTNRFQLYGRFLNAVGLGRLIGAKKRSHEREHIIRPNTVTITGNDLTKMPPPLSPQMPTSSKKAAQQTPTKALNQKTTQVTATTSNTVSNMPPPPAPPVQPVLVECDSDSNYSFSDHFEVSSTTKSSPEAPKTIEHDQEAQDSTQISTTTAPLPDFISLDGAGNRFQETADTLDLPISTLHTRFVEANSDDDDADTEHDTDVANVVMPAVEQEKPCEAKIFISNEHYRYFQSKEGQVYLCKVLPEYELTGSLDKTSAGYALFLTGLPKNQDKMQQALLKKYEDLNNAKAKHQLDNQLPKNVNTLIRFLRDSIKQLYNNLGSATDLYKRLYDCEKMQTKISQKSADRIRRTLNMILLGQAGLHNGDAHFETLLKSLRKLLSTECNKVEKTPEKLREEINASWRMLFTSYDHKRYSSLLAAYIQMPATKRNRMHTLKIEANILDDRVLDVSLSKEQKERLNDANKSEQKMEKTDEKSESDATVNTNNKEVRKETAELATVAPVVLAQQSSELNESNKKSNNKTKNLNVTTTTNKTATTTTTSSSTEAVQNDNVDIIDSFSENLIKAIEESFNSIECGPRVHASKSLSTVWSNKSQEILNEIIVLPQSIKSKHLDRLERISKHAAEGKLSYINYCDIVKIHKRVMKK